MNGKLERNGKTIPELEAEIDKYFDENDKYSIETLYMTLGIKKQDIYYGRDATSYKLKKQAEMIDKARDAIHSYFACKASNTVMGNANSMMLYMKNRFKDDWDENPDDTSGNVVINISNDGGNSIG